MPRKKQKQKPRAKPKPKPAKKPRARAIIRNGTPARARLEREPEAASERIALTERVDTMGVSHVSAGIGAGVLGNATAVLLVGQGWVGPKVTAGLLMGTGVAATAAGWYWEMDHLMAAGAGVAAAGAFSMTNQLAVDAYEGMEARAEERREKRERDQAEKDREKKLAEARALLDAEKRDKTRNGRRFVIIDENGEELDYDLVDAI